jgi:hypothetical protein
MERKNKVMEPYQDVKSHNVCSDLHCCFFVFERLSAYLRIFAAFFSPPLSPRHVAVRMCIFG